MKKQIAKSENYGEVDHKTLWLVKRNLNFLFNIRLILKSIIANAFITWLLVIQFEFSNEMTKAGKTKPKLNIASSEWTE